MRQNFEEMKICGEMSEKQIAAVSQELKDASAEREHLREKVKQLENENEQQTASCKLILFLWM